MCQLVLNKEVYLWFLNKHVARLASFIQQFLCSENVSFFLFFAETIFPSTAGKRKKTQTNTLWMDSKSLISEDIVLEVVESILVFFLL